MSLAASPPGFSADIIAVEGDLLQDIDALKRVRFVIARGRTAE
jgi:imidazolonepropionase-like amidohydrolase